MGETGTGKTTVVQRLAALVGAKLQVFNMSQQSDSSDILGGFKPVSMRLLAEPLFGTFQRLFFGTFSRKKNAQVTSLPISLCPSLPGVPRTRAERCPEVLPTVSTCLVELIHECPCRAVLVVYGQVSTELCSPKMAPALKSLSKHHGNGSASLGGGPRQSRNPSTAKGVDRL